MEREYTNRLIGVTLFLALVVMVLFALAPTPALAAASWQDKQLYNPGHAQLERERKGLVTIYSGYTDLQVDEVMDRQFDRVESMMFVNTVVTTPDGTPKQDPGSGEVETEDDGC